MQMFHGFPTKILSEELMFHGNEVQGEKQRAVAKAGFGDYLYH